MEPQRPLRPVGRTLVTRHLVSALRELRDSLAHDRAHTNPTETLAEIRAAAAAELPGARIRRRLFWRYTLVFDKPAGLS